MSYNDSSSNAVLENSDKPNNWIGCLVLFGVIGVPAFIVLLIIIITTNDNKKMEQLRTKYCGQGDIASQQGNYATALADYQKFEKIYPDDPIVHHSEAWALIRMRRLREGRSELVYAIRLTRRRHGGDRPDQVNRYAWRAELKELDTPNVTAQDLANFKDPPPPSYWSFN